MDMYNARMHRALHGPGALWLEAGRPRRGGQGQVGQQGPAAQRSAGGRRFIFRIPLKSPPLSGVKDPKSDRGTEFLTPWTVEKIKRQDPFGGRLFAELRLTLPLLPLRDY